MKLSAVAAAEIVGAVFVIVVGALMHFAYQWFCKNPVVGLFAPVNESTWEHLKLLFFPMLCYSAIEYLFFGQYIENFIGAKTIAILVGMITIVVVFYTYTGLLGTHYLWADILTFVIGVLAAYAISWVIIKNGYSIPNRSGILLILITACFFIFTFHPPQIPLFLDPVTKGYGLKPGAY